jgi:hypothetical protein
MLHPETAASPAIFVMWLVCALSVGFMVRFLIALTIDDRTMRAPKVRPGGLHYADRVCEEIPYRQTALESAAHLAIGVDRITTALASSAVAANRHARAERLHAVRLGGPRQDLDFTAERRYRSS